MKKEYLLDIELSDQDSKEWYQFLEKKGAFKKRMEKIFDSENNIIGARDIEGIEKFNWNDPEIIEKWNTIVQKSDVTKWNQTINEFIDRSAKYVLGQKENYYILQHTMRIVLKHWDLLLFEGKRKPEGQSEYVKTEISQEIYSDVFKQIARMLEWLRDDKEESFMFDSYIRHKFDTDIREVYYPKIQRLYEQAGYKAKRECYPDLFKPLEYKELKSEDQLKAKALILILFIKQNCKGSIPTVAQGSKVKGQRVFRNEFLLHCSEFGFVPDVNQEDSYISLWSAIKKNGVGSDTFKTAIDALKAKEIYQSQIETAIKHFDKNK